MRVVADTNTVVSGLLWSGAPRQILDMARSGEVELFASAVLLAELEDVLRRGKFAKRIALAGVEAIELVLGYAALANLVEPSPVEGIITDDPEDDAVLGCAVAARAEVIISGDSHLLRLRRYQGIPIFAADDLLSQISKQ